MCSLPIIAEDFERHIVIVTPSYNNKQWYKKNLDSIFAQKYLNYKLIYIDDCSTDGTYELVHDYICKRGQEDRVILLHNDTRRYALANVYTAIHQYCKDTDITIVLDADDWLANDQVLSYINKIYTDENIWITYGQIREYPRGGGGCREISRHIVQRNAFRKEAHWPYFPSHLHTFYAGLFKQIKKEDLMYKGDFFPMTYDLAMMFPMLEMARDGHIKFIRDVLVIYNLANSLNAHKVSKKLQHETHIYIRSMTPYNKVERLFRNM